METTVHDRALGVILASACGDALGAGYEFGPPLPADEPITMRGGGNAEWAPGEWTDDTSMMIPILESIASGHPLDDPSTLGRIVAEWADWAQDGATIGRQTAAVFGRLTANTEDAARAAAAAVHAERGRSGGNGSLMRTAPIALAFLGDGQKRPLADAARRISELTHVDEDAGDACTLWSAAIRSTVRRGSLELRAGIPLLAKDRRTIWLDRIEEAEQSQPEDFTDRNRWVVGAIQGAIAAVVRGSDLVDVIERAVRGGNDTDTVATIAGALGGAVHGASALPERWTLLVHGWPGKRLEWLQTLTERALERVPEIRRNERA
ncbi:ADP-ribosylglycohydrolase family protein [Curtobacterium ammoniigenes]|uniref:ADP-ribosylglycohydrolase family protein n=1 Tax=Curtobacterium ammoniigenes TaxID=395387 RepID=UPI0008314A3B|nr:ADP-ribosylglycohydrolase family protein [Curtobacterium ammoniigenes]